METKYSKRTRAIKEVLVPKFGRKNLSVRQGRGSAHHWVDVLVRLPKKVPEDSKAQFQEESEIRERIEEIITSAGIRLSQYATDYGPASQKHPYANCLSITVEFSQ
jgi:hypothetical protein